MWQNRFRTAAACFLLFIVAASWAAAQSYSAYSLGGVTYARSAAPALRVPVSVAHAFFRGVGGVAFSAVAESADGGAVTALGYDGSRPDGQRLLVTVQGFDGNAQTVAAGIFDWQLVPIARFAADVNGSAMTLFGQLEDKTAEKQLLDAKNRIINYHDQLDNTLVGLRLLQADILIIQENSTDLFADSSGILILGDGEIGHDVDQNRQRFAELAQWQDQRASEGQKYQSYVVGDIGQRVTFSVQDGRLAFTGIPYWYCWQSKPELKQNLEQLGALEAPLVEQYNGIASEAQTYASSVEIGWPTMTDEEKLAANARIGEYDSTLSSKKQQIETLRSQFESTLDVLPMPELSDALSNKIYELGGINPIVYQTLTTVMHTAALFRHFKERDPAGYDLFVQSLGGVPVVPAVETPTIQYSALQ